MNSSSEELFTLQRFRVVHCTRHYRSTSAIIWTNPIVTWFLTFHIALFLHMIVHVDEELQICSLARTRSCWPWTSGDLISPCQLPASSHHTHPIVIASIHLCIRFTSSLNPNEIKVPVACDPFSSRFFSDACHDNCIFTWFLTFHITLFLHMIVHIDEELQICSLVRTRSCWWISGDLISPC